LKRYKVFINEEITFENEVIIEIQDDSDIDYLLMVATQGQNTTDGVIGNLESLGANIIDFSRDEDGNIPDLEIDDYSELED
jgi:hypothetical protein